MSSRASSSSPSGPRTELDPMAPTIESVPPPKSIDATIAALPNVVLPTITLSESTSHDPFTLASGEVSAGAVEVGKAELGTLASETRYEPGPLLGTGGMGEVRLCGDLRIGRRVAKKTLHADTDTPMARARFLREARVQGQLEHHSIVPVYDLDLDEEGRAFFTMKRVRGDTLERILEHLRKKDEAFVKRYAERRLLAAFVQVCLTIDYAHTRGVLHRDLKPGNVMLGDFGEVYVLDWGLAKIVGENSRRESVVPELLEKAHVDGHVAIKMGQAPRGGPEGLSSDDAALTAEGALLGTPAYMAPEQIIGHDAVDARADVFALGAILFEILTLSRLRTATRIDELMKAALMGVPTHPSERVPTVAPELDALCARALAQAPEERLDSARELAEGLERYLDGDRDLSLRRDLAKAHVEKARACLASEEKASKEIVQKDQANTDTQEESPRVIALREVIQALALDPEDQSAQRLFVELIVHTKDVPREALPELARAQDKSRAETMRGAAFGLLAWAAVVPMVLAIGVINKPAIAAATVVDLGAALFAWVQSRRQSFGPLAAMTAAVLVAATVAFSSCYLGPFALMPTAGVSAMLITSMHATPYERRLGAAIFVAFTSLPFLAELTGMFGHAYIFESNRLIILARTVALPETLTLLAMLYSTVSFIILSGVLVGRMRDQTWAIEQQRLVQAWLLRRLFPDAMGKT
jgi:eukaryotic-like serine/threonine-protein kinase